MKTVTTMILTLVLFTSLIFAQSAGLFIENERIEDDLFKFEISIQRTAAWPGDGLGHADFYFDYNADGLGASVSATNLHPAIDGNSSYVVTSNVNGGLLHVKIDYSVSGSLSWLPALNLTEQICTVEMEIVDAAQMSGLEWDVINTGVLTTDLSSIQKSFQGSGDISLPVELAAFEGRYINGAVELSWRTESEFQNWGFFIYRSDAIDGLYERINPSIIKGAGSSTMPHDYSFIDDRVDNNSVYYYLLENIDVNGHADRSSPIRVQTGGTTVTAVEQYSLEQNYPNPFNPETTISFSLAHAGDVEISIFSIDGKLVRTLIDSNIPAGEHNVVWDGRDTAGLKSPSGSYLYQLRTSSFTHTKKLTLLR